MPYKRITCDKDLREALSSPESWELDFKHRVNVAEWWELAKDVAAFANHVGGTLVVGSREGDPRAPGLSEDDAHKTADAYERAARDRCVPRPQVASRVFPQGPSQAGFFIVVVNIEPSPEQLVGAMAPLYNRNDAPVSSDAWRFFVRVGKDNMPLTPDQLPMYMNAKTRRIAILLDAIPSDKRELTIFWRRPGNQFDEKPVEKSCKLDRVNPAGNVVLLESLRTGSTSYHYRVPLDDIDGVWEYREGSWAVRVTGFFDGEREYITNPSNAVILHR